MLNPDTHMVVFAVTGELSPNEQQLLEGQPWSISSIVLWELSKLVQLDRIGLDLDDPAVTRALSRLHVWPVNLAVARVSTMLDFRSEPADELIAATSIVRRVPLVTRDPVLRASELIPLAL